MESNSKYYLTIFLSILLSVSITIGSVMYVPQLQEAIRGPQGLPGLQGEQGIQGLQGPQGLEGTKGDRGPVGPKGEDYAYNGEWVYVDGWEWDGTNLDEDIERIIYTDGELWRVYWIILSEYRSVQWFAIDVYSSPDYSNITESVGTNMNFGADVLYCYGKGSHGINIAFEGQDYVFIFIEKYINVTDPNA